MGGLLPLPCIAAAQMFWLPQFATAEKLKAERQLWVIVWKLLTRFWDFCGFVLCLLCP